MASVTPHMTSQTVDSKKTPAEGFEAAVVAHACCHPAAMFSGGDGEAAPGGGGDVGKRPKRAPGADGRRPATGARGQAGGGAGRTGQGC